MKVEIYAQEEKVGEVTFNPFEYTYLGDIADVDNFLERLSNTGGPKVYTANLVENTNEAPYHQESYTDDATKKANKLQQDLNVMFGLDVEIIE